MADINDLLVRIDATTEQLRREMKRAEKSVEGGAKKIDGAAARIQAAFSRINKKVGESAAALNRWGGVAVVAAGAAFTALIKKQIDAADAIGKMAQATGTSAEFLSSMGFVAEQTGTSLETIARSTQLLSKNMDDFRMGIGEARYAFEALGLEVTQSNGNLRDVQDVLLDVADAFSKMADGADKTAMARRLFGRGGNELIPMLNKGRDGIEELTAKAREMGLVISTETAMQAAYLNDQLNELKNTGVGWARSIAVEMLPSLNEAIKTIRHAAEESGLLTAAWVALGAAGTAMFVGSTTRQINAVRKEIDGLEASIKRIEERRSGRDLDIRRYEVLTTQLADARVALADLERQKEQEDQAEERRMQDALRRQHEEAEARRAATDEMRAQAEARAAAAQAAREEELAQRAREQAEVAARQAIEGQIDALADQAATFGMSAREATLYRISLMDGVTPAQLELAAAILSTIEAQESQSERMDRAKAIMASVQTAAERYAETIAELQELLQAGVISQETYTRAVVQAVDAFKDSTEVAQDGFADLKRAIEGWGRSSAGVFADMAMSSKASFRDLIDSMIRDMIRMAAYQAIFGPLFAGIGGAMSGEGFKAGVASFGGKRAAGGPVAGGPSGRTFLVGERGPELLRMGPGTSGQVIPNHKMASAGGQIEVVFNIDARGADAQLTRALPAILEQQAQRIKADIATSRSRGRSL